MYQKKLDSRTLITEFHERMLEKYPDLSYEDVREICYAPFYFVRKQMEEGNLLRVRLKYLGTFTVFKGRAEGLLKRLKDQFEKQRIEPSEYFRIKKMIETYLEKNEKDI